MGDTAESDRATDWALIELWKKTVDAQQHFNDIELRIRNIAITIIGIVLGIAAVAFREGQFLVSFLILAVGFVLWVAFFSMDFLWYHRLLKGAVAYGVQLEDVIGRRLEDRGISELSEAGLAKSIGAKSPIIVPDRWWLGLCRGRSIGSEYKMMIFYGLISICLVLAGGYSAYRHVALEVTPVPEVSEEPTAVCGRVFPP